jgi:hypothetical protein
VNEPLEALGLQLGDRVRFRRREGGRWHTGVVRGREADGSLAITDEKGAARALPPDRVEVATPGPRGARGWESVAERAARTEQMRLL